MISTLGTVELILIQLLVHLSIQRSFPAQGVLTISMGLHSYLPTLINCPFEPRKSQKLKLVYLSMIQDVFETKIWHHHPKDLALSLLRASDHQSWSRCRSTGVRSAGSPLQRLPGNAGVAPWSAWPTSHCPSYLASRPGGQNISSFF